MKVYTEEEIDAMDQDTREIAYYRLVAEIPESVRSKIVFCPGPEMWGTTAHLLKIQSEVTRLASLRETDQMLTALAKRIVDEEAT